MNLTGFRRVVKRIKQRGMYCTLARILGSIVGADAGKRHYRFAFSIFPSTKLSIFDGEMPRERLYKNKPETLNRLQQWMVKLNDRVG